MILCFKCETDCRRNGFVVFRGFRFGRRLRRFGKHAFDRRHDLWQKGNAEADRDEGQKHDRHAGEGDADTLSVQDALPADVQGIGH